MVGNFKISRGARCTFLLAKSTDFIALFSSGDANVEWMEDEAAIFPVLSAIRAADGSAEEHPESTKSAIAFDISLNRPFHSFSTFQSVKLPSLTVIG